MSDPRLDDDRYRSRLRWGIGAFLAIVVFFLWSIKIEGLDQPSLRVMSWPLHDQKRGDAMHWYWNGYGHMAWMGLWWILGAVALAAVLWATLASAGRPMNGRGDSPERIARKRYARGEIDHDAFQKIMHDLKG